MLLFECACWKLTQTVKTCQGYNNTPLNYEKLLAAGGKTHIHRCTAVPFISWSWTVCWHIQNINGLDAIKSIFHLVSAFSFRILLCIYIYIKKLSVIYFQYYDHQILFLYALLYILYSMCFISYLFQTVFAVTSVVV